MIRNWQFTFPSRIQFGRGLLRRVGLAAQPLGSRAMLVSYAGNAGPAGAAATAEKALSDAKLSVIPYLAVVGEPTVEIVEHGAQIARTEQVDLVVAVGGGSVIDAAKGIALLSRMDGALTDYADTTPNRKPAGEAIPVVAVPTTAGTGAEATQVAVFSHQGAKISITAPALRPAVALIDPDLSSACDAATTAACGADALAHAMEACMSRAAQPVSTALAFQAIELVVNQLPTALAQPGNREARDALAVAAALAGMALNESGVTLTHSVAHALGAMLHLPHGQCVARATPLNLRANRSACEGLYARWARLCGLHGDDDAALADAWIARIEALLGNAGLLGPLPRAATAPETTLWTRDHWAAELARCAFQTTPTPLRLNPVPIDEAALAQGIAEQVLNVGWADA